MGQEPHHNSCLPSRVVEVQQPVETVGRGNIDGKAADWRIRQVSRGTVSRCILPNQMLDSRSVSTPAGTAVAERRLSSAR